MTGGSGAEFFTQHSENVSVKTHCIYDAQGNFVCIKDDNSKPVVHSGKPVGFPSKIKR
jgi:hypothetical protein